MFLSLWKKAKEVLGWQSAFEKEVLEALKDCEVKLQKLQEGLEALDAVVEEIKGSVKEIKDPFYNFHAHFEGGGFPSWSAMDLLEKMEDDLLLLPDMYPEKDFSSSGG